jgi:hypothetical protein
MESSDMTENSLRFHVRLGFTVSTELRVLRTRYWMTPPYVRHRWFTFYSPRAYRVYRPWDYML